MFWNHSIEGYMEERLQQDSAQGSTKSFPDYMNVFITEYSDIFSKVYFLTSKEIYVLDTYEEGGGECKIPGGVYPYDTACKGRRVRSGRGWGAYYQRSPLEFREGNQK